MINEKSEDKENFLDYYMKHIMKIQDMVIDTEVNNMRVFKDASKTKIERAIDITYEELMKT